MSLFLKKILYLNCLFILYIILKIYLIIIINIIKLSKIIFYYINFNSKKYKYIFEYIFQKKIYIIYI